MKLVSFDVTTRLGPIRRVGAVCDRLVVDVNLAYRDVLLERHGTPRAAEIADAVVPPTMLQLIENGAAATEALQTAVDHALRRAEDGTARDGIWDVDEIELAPPLPNPRSLREFGQFLGHATQGGRKELAATWYEAPHYWKGNPSTIVGPDTEVAWPDGVDRLDFELEIACVIGRAGRDVPPGSAMAHVFGFTLFNDICARDLQARELPAMKGPSKSHDFCSVMGPLLVTADELDLDNLTGRVTVNGEQWAAASTDDMYFSWPEVIAHASRYDGIVPGDVLVSGTLTGCSAIEHYGWPQSGPLLRPGDIVELELDGLGVLRNRIGAREDSAPVDGAPTVEARRR